MLQHNELYNFNFFIIGTSQVFAHSYVKGAIAIINYSENKFKSFLSFLLRALQTETFKAVGSKCPRFLNLSGVFVTASF